MEVVKSVNKWVSSWSTGGEQACRAFLSPHHANPLDATSVGALFNAYQALLFATLASWSTKATIPHETFTTFVQSVLESLPSSSSLPSTAKSTVGEQLVDMIWSLDAQLDDIINDAKAASSNTNAEVASKAKDSKLRAEGDKMTIIAIVKRLLAVGIIKPVTAAERLDSALLASAGLFPDKVTLDKKEIRTRTGLFYKQNKFNLLREQSEGYSKLTTELTSSLGPPHSPSSGRPAESLEAIEERARPVWDKIISLIGYFDLDPNRALDIILDIFCVHIATHYTFFVALLSFSPWCGSYKRRIASSMSVDSEATPSEGKSLDDILAACEATETDCSSGHRPRVLAQVLGFKFAFHNTPDAPQPAPRNLYLTAALLIREKFITLEDIYPHLTLNDPEDGGLGAYKDTVKARIAAAKVSQLAMAAPLESTSTTTTTARAKEKSPSEAKDPPDQKSGIVAALLSIGSLRPALWVLSKYPWMVDAHPDIADLMIRVMKVSMNPLYETTLVQKPHNASFLQPRSRYSAAGIAQPAPRKQVLTLWAPTPPCTHSTEFVFFYPDWIENVPICNTLDDLMNIIDPLLAFVKLHISRDVIFMTKFLRLGRKQLHGTIPSDPSVKPDTEHPVRQFWLKALRSYILPGVSLLRGNAVCNVEVWNMVKLYGLTERWCLYGEWKSSLYDQHTELSVRKVEADRESKAILRRLSHNTIESLSGPIAKLAHSNPCIFFANVVNQVMAYDNLAGVVVLGLVYVTVMGFDVLVYIILDAMSNTYKDRVKDDGVNTSDWLQSLASFTGMLYRRYGADLSPVLQYIVHQLQNRVSTDIVVLRELIWKMAGIEPLPSLSESQVAAMAGGPALRIEAVASATRGARVDPGDLGMRGPGRLGRALVETGLALPLLVQVAQQRQTAIFSNKQAYLKSLAGLYDTTHGVLLQYIELLTSPSVVALDDYAKKVLPPIGDLSEKYGISAPICMQVLRPVLNNALLKSAIAKEERDHAANQEQEKRLKAALKAKQDPTTTASRVASPVPKTEKAGDASVKPVTEDDTPMDVDTTQVSPAPTSPWLPELEELFEELKRVVPERAYNTIGPGFYLTFWQLSTYDLAPPGSRYDDETSNLRTLSRQEDAKALNAERSNDRRIRSTASAHRARRERYNQFIQTLNAEFKNQTISRAFTLKRISREKAHWFAHGPPANLLVEALVQNCIIPRCLLSPMDADYAAQMVRVLHASGTPGFNTLLCYDTILADMPKAILFSCSEYEARNYGRFLHAILADLYKWHLDEQVFVQDNRTKVGGKYVSHPGMKMKFRSDTEHMPWDSFRQILRKWHTRLVIGFRASLQTGEFMHIYNTFLVLKELLPVFPIAEVAGHAGRFLDEAISVCLANEKRRDLAILGGAYAASLKKREAFWHPPTPTNPSTVNGSSPAPAANTAAVPTKPRNAPPTGPNSSMNGDSKRGNGAPTQVAPAAPSGPRAQPPTPALPEKPANGATGTGPKLSVEGIARPPVTKRIQREHDSASPKPSSELARPIPTGPAAVKDGALSQPSSRRGSPAINDLSHRSLPRDTASVVNSSPLGREPPKSPRNHRTEEKPVRADSQPQPVMPPPAAPSQTTSAQELRENAKQSRYDKPADDKRNPQEPRSQTGSAAASPKQRSPSPMSRPGTRNSSADSRGSRSRKPTESDDRRANKDKDARDNIRRDSLTIPTRLLRDEKDERERERDRGDRGGRDKHERDRRDKERDRERGDRERERDRNGESRDRHRRGDEKDRDRKDREGSSIRGSAVASSGRTEDLKRKRGEEEPSDRSRRSSRKDGSHREDRSRRSEKDAHDRDSRLDRGRDHDRRSRRDRPPSEDRGSGGDKSSDRRPAEPAATSTSKLPPSQPRAERSGKPEAPVVGEQEKPGNGEDQEVTNPGIKKDATEPSLLQRIDTTTTNNTNPPPLTPQSSREDDGRGSRKRSAPGIEGVPGLNDALDAGHSAKRPRIVRGRQGVVHDHLKGRSGRR